MKFRVITASIMGTGLALNTPITTDPYYGEKVGNIETFIKRLQSTNVTLSTFTAKEGRTTVGTLEEAKYFTSHAGLSYCNAESLKSWTCKHCKRIVNNITLVNIIDEKKYDCRAVVFIDEPRKEIHLSFRGSVNQKNWVENLKFDKTKFESIKDAQVHIGFKNTADSMRKAYVSELQKLYAQPKYSNYNFILSGHSSGGAVALIAMLYLQSDLKLPWQQLHTFTYGQPRVGNLAFINYLNSLPFHVTRIVNENDLVAHLPPNFSNYYHYHTEIYINKNVSVICRTDVSEDPECSNSRVPLVSIDPHTVAWGIPLGSNGC